jgi:hypothetical protein
MLIWRSWFDLRGGFYIALGVLLLLLALVIAAYPIVSRVKTTGPVAQEQLRQLQDYSQYLYTQWFASNNAIVLYIATILLALRGVPGEKRTGAFLITLSLPVRRWIWPVAHAGMTSLLVLILLIISPIGVAVGSLLIGKSYSLESLGVMVFGGWLLCFPWIGLSVVLNSFLHSGLKSALILIPMNLFGATLLKALLPILYRWSPWQLLEAGVWQHIPWGPILISLFVGSGGVALAAVRFMREEL